MYQQGDILFKEVESIPQDAHLVKENPVIIARGESTGHSHKVVAVLDRTEVFVDRKEEDKFYVRGPATITHEEHGPITIPEGVVVHTDRVREYDHFREESRRVID